MTRNPANRPMHICDVVGMICLRIIGASVNDIAARFDRGPNLVHLYVSGIQPRWQREPRLTAEQRRRIVRLVEMHGIPFAHIADQMSCSGKTVALAYYRARPDLAPPNLKTRTGSHGNDDHE